VGIVTFTGQPRVVIEIGPPEAARRALDELKVPVDRSGTEAKLALRRAQRLLEAAPQRRGAARRPAIVFLSDGIETNRQQQKVRRDAERTASELAADGIAVHSLSFGSDAADEPEPMQRIAAFGRGRYVHVFRPEDALALVAPAPGIAELPVTNRALPDDPPRALRVFADGSFDGFVPLVPGENAIELEVVLADGRRARAQRRLIYEPTGLSGTDEELLTTLRERTAETALAGESQTGSGRRRTFLEIRGEPPPEPGGAREAR
jgi:hypothetical protein